MKKVIHIKTMIAALAVICMTSCAEEDLNFNSIGKGGELHITSVNVGDTKLSSRVTYAGERTISYNSVVNGFSRGDKIELTYSFDDNSANSSAKASFVEGTIWNIVDDKGTSLSLKPTGSSDAWEKLKMNASFLPAEEKSLESNDFSTYGIALADGIGNTQIMLYADELEATSEPEGGITINKTLTDPKLGQIKIVFKHAHALLYLNTTNIETPVKDGEVITGGLKTLWVELENTDETTIYVPLTLEGNVHQAIVPAGYTIKGFKAVVAKKVAKNEEESSYVTFDLNGNYSGSLSANSKYNLNLTISNELQNITLSANEKPGWGETIDMDYWKKNAISQLKYENYAFIVSGEEGFLLLNEWMTNDSAEDFYFKKITGYTSSLSTSKMSHNVTLADDINFNDNKYKIFSNNSSNWVALDGYSGTFNGNGHTIKGLSVSPTSGNVGLIGKLNAGGTIVNVNVEGLTATSGTNVGGLVGLNNGGTIGACSVTGAVSGSSSINVGGLVGKNTTGSVISSYTTGTVSGGTNMGSIVGNNSATIIGCYYSGSTKGVGIGVDKTTKVDGSSVKWVPGNKENGAMNMMNFKMTDNLKSVLGSGYGWIENNGTDKTYCPLIISSSASFNIYDYVIKTNTYEVYTAQGLIYWNQLSDDDNSSHKTNVDESRMKYHLKLMDDIDLTNSSSNWRTFGWNNRHYNGIIDGNGKTITGLGIKGSSYLGFIGVLGEKGVIMNLHLRAVNVNGSSNYCGGIAGTNHGTIIGCSVSGNVIIGGRDAGGIVGVNFSSGKIIGCYNLASVTANGTKDSYYGAGGIAGRFGEGTDKGGVILGCYNIGDISTNLYKGPICGGVNKGHFEDCYWTGDYEKPFGKDYNNNSKVTNCNKVSDLTTVMSQMNAAISSYNIEYRVNDFTSEPLKLVVK